MFPYPMPEPHARTGHCPDQASVWGSAWICNEKRRCRRECSSLAAKSQRVSVVVGSCFPVRTRFRWRERLRIKPSGTPPRASVPIEGTNDGDRGTELAMVLGRAGGG